MLVEENVSQLIGYLDCRIRSFELKSDGAERSEVEIVQRDRVVRWVQYAFHHQLS